MRRPFLPVFAVLVVLSMLMAACAPAAAPTAAPVEATAVPAEPTAAPVEPTAVPTAEPVEADPGDPTLVTGDIYTAGSSTVGPLTEAIIEQFGADGFSGQIKNDIIGTGAGFERFCKTGESDIANASRPIKDSEAEACAALSPARTPVAFLVGLDAIAVVVNPENDWVTDLTLDQLAQLMTSAEKWSDVDPSWPAEPVLRYTPGTDSGTFDFFVETVVQKPQKIEKLDDAKALVLEAKNLNQSEDDNVLVQGIEGNKYAIGYFGFAYYKEEGSKLKALTLEGVAPSEDTAEDGSYKLARPLFIYSDAGVMQAKPQVATFIYYYIENANSVIDQVGYFPASAEAAETNLAAWNAAMGK
jgi:phosphate transport system substrate-binding protein